MREKPIRLTVKERATLEKFCTAGVRDVRLVNRAKIILALDISGGRTPERQESLAEHLGISRQTINNAKKDFLAAANTTIFLQRKQRKTPPIESKITGELEARIIALACSEAPEGRAKWTLRLLAAECVQLQYCDTMSHMTISRLLKKRNLNLI